MTRRLLAIIFPSTLEDEKIIVVKRAGLLMPAVGRAGRLVEVRLAIGIHLHIRIGGRVFVFELTRCVLTSA